jgi:hypothetical protein
VSWNESFLFWYWWIKYSTFIYSRQRVGYLVQVVRLVLDKADSGKLFLDEMIGGIIELNWVFDEHRWGSIMWPSELANEGLIIALTYTTMRMHCGLRLILGIYFLDTRFGVFIHDD